MSHTPGKWTVVRHYGGSFSIEPRVAWLGSSTSVPREVNEANARLIAKAPEMYEIIDRIATFDFMGLSEFSQLVKKCRALIKEIEGE